MSVEAAVRGALIGVIVVEVLSFLGRHFAWIAKFLMIGAVVTFVMYPLANTDMNDSEMTDIIQSQAAENYTTDGQSVSMHFNNGSRFQIEKGVVVCGGARVSIDPITILPHSEANLTWRVFEKLKGSCALTFKPREIVRYRSGNTLYSYDLNEDSKK